MNENISISFTVILMHCTVDFIKKTYDLTKQKLPPIISAYFRLHKRIPKSFNKTIDILNFINKNNNTVW